MKQNEAPGLIDYSIDRYAGSIIDGLPHLYDAIEVQGVRSQKTGTHSFVYEVDNLNPEAYSVYLHMKEGGVVCVGDCTLREHAKQYAADLSELHDWPVHDFTHDPKPAPESVLTK